MVVVFDIQSDDLVSFAPDQKEVGDAWVEKLKLNVTNQNLAKLKKNLLQIKEIDGQIQVSVMDKLIIWIMERMFFDVMNSDTEYLKCLLEPKILQLPVNFLNVMIGFENHEMIQYYFNTHLQSDEIADVNAMDEVSSVEHCMRHFPLRGQTLLTTCILTFTPRRICGMRVNRANPNIPLQVVVETQEGSYSASQILDTLLQLPYLNVDQPNAMGWTPLCLAIKQRLWSTVQKLLKRGCSTMQCSTVFGKNITPWFLAYEQGNVVLGDHLKNTHQVLERVLYFQSKEMALMEIVRNNQEKLIDAIVDRKQIDMNFRDSSGFSFFDVAMMSDSVHMFYKLKRLNGEQLRKEMMFDVTKGDIYGNTLLHKLVNKVNQVLISVVTVGYWDFPILLESVFDFIACKSGNSQSEMKYLANAVNSNGLSCLHILAQCKGLAGLKSKPLFMDIHVQIFATLVEMYDADINQRIQKCLHTHGGTFTNFYKEEGDSQNVLMVAMQKQNIWICRYLLENHGDSLLLNATDDFLNTLLHTAFCSGSYVLIEPNNAQAAPLKCARIYLMDKILTLWKRTHVDAYFDMVNFQNREMYTVLHFVAKHARTFDDALFRLFEVHVPRFDIQDINGNTPLMLALKNGKYDKRILHFFSKDVPLSMVDGMNGNIFHVLANCLFGEHSIYLLDLIMIRKRSGDSILRALNHRDLDGNTPLVYACKRNNQQLALEFIKRGALWYGQNVLKRDFLFYANEDLNAFLFENYIWKAKMDVVCEGIIIRDWNKSLLRMLDNDILKTIFNIGKKHFFRSAAI